VETLSRLATSAIRLASSFEEGVTAPVFDGFSKNCLKNLKEFETDDEPLIPSLLLI